MKRTNYEALHYVFFYILLLFPSLLDPNIHLSTLSSNTLNPCSSLMARKQISQLYKTTGKIIAFLSFNFYVFRYETGRRKILNYSLRYRLYVCLFNDAFSTENVCEWWIGKNVEWSSRSLFIVLP